jgi:hypothetical protein
MNAMVPMPEPTRRPTGLSVIQTWQQSRRDRELEVQLSDRTRDAIAHEYDKQLEHHGRLLEMGRTEERATTAVGVVSRVYDVAAAATNGDPGKAAFLMPIIETTAGRSAGLVCG